MEDIADDNMLKKPCRSCPFRRASAAGWLGASSPEQFMLATFGEAEIGGEFFMQVKNEEPMPCHLTINYDDPEWLEKWEEGWKDGQETGSLCAGAAVMFANRVKKPRIDLPEREADRDNVFTHTKEFVEHHNNARVKSWEFGGEDEE